MALVQKRIYELISQYLPDAADDFSNIFIAVDKNGFEEAKRMPLSVLISSSLHIEGVTQALTGTSHEISFDSTYSSSDYYLNLTIYKDETNGGDTTRTIKPIKNLVKANDKFTFETYEESGTGLTMDYIAINR